MFKLITKRNISVALGGLVFFVNVLVVSNYIVVQRYSKYIISDIKTSEIKVGIVFGGGISNLEPLQLLKDRLDKAKKLLEEGVVEKLLLSGDDRTLEYNEPGVMFRYLVNEGVDATLIQQDYAGRSTYETCERAERIFGLKSAVLISERTHLPRAIYLCRHFGVDVYGVYSDGKATSGLQLGQRWREILASNKAIFNTYIVGEKTVLGEPIDYLTDY